MKRFALSILAAAAVAAPWTAQPALAATEDEREAVQAQEYRLMLEEAERARVEAEAARREASRLSERARELARLHAERARLEAERAAADTQQSAAEQAAREAELDRVREELSRTHRELRAASRDVARAHRELARAERERALRFVNLGDRAVIGVVLGRSSPDGIELVGVSPGGPAEEAGIQAGDRMVEIAGQDLRDDPELAGTRVFEVMEATRPGETLDIVVERDGQPLQFAVEAELREPSSWQSIVRIPEVAGLVDPGLLEDTEIIVERIEVPDIDHEALQDRVRALQERLESRSFIFVDPEHEGGDWHGEFEFDVDAFSGLADRAFAEADVFFGLPAVSGLEFATVNPDLGAYFGTERGVLVLRAREDNAYGLQAGDVILTVAGEAVDTPSQLLRALRRAEPGETLSLGIKRDQDEQTLETTMPENRLGLR